MGYKPDFGCMSKTQKSAFYVNLVANQGKLECPQKLFTKGKSTTPSPACSKNEPFVFTINLINDV